MIWIDYAIIGLISISLIIGLFRGLVREAFALVTWGLAIWIGFTFSLPFATFFETSISIPSARIATAFVLLFLLTLIVGAIINKLLSTLISKTGLTGSDRLAGLVFGIIRGVMIIILLVMLAGLTPVPESSWWQKSELIPHFQILAVWLQTHIPDGIANYLNY
ncbi:membrane protein required for colicin V production [Bathymodiolus platifrons methanotrophic gill symbiont]|uniref:CvpA family protein n=1 Tax=Bathymodiolus platifrons methanotrophic gill symbiont TaxID=113268 RepID=UPI000B421F79|nr:CvpA family protein [Bathymodiolus platifrons methanotrophic gill symbiont]TXL01906.1 colicin V production CvpA [Methylococcaceae bacterium HT1]TXL16140.1 colicin V production CvpA [Methylococcaceae bacterium HT4]TXL17993.1 colicin V production CvpA [Methylococcaceae bacterium HT3]TXL20280.1 colicin V production CvpA [Methylococcaceae bacterium HT5]TXL22553.1 colicin V production CvpA [Methylococcaceae bacterium HT2]